MKGNHAPRFEHEIGPVNGAVWAAVGVMSALMLVAVDAKAEDLESDAVYLPMPQARAVSVRNPLGTVRMQGWDRDQIRIIANKRAGSKALLERLKVRVDVDQAADGTAEVRVTTGFYLSDGAFTPLPLSGGGIDLTIDAPRKAQLTALTFTGDINASGFRAGASLSSQGGQIRVSDVEGPVDTKTLKGNQWLEAIRGSLLASGVVGDVELEDVDGKRIDATVYKGQIVARDVRGATVKLRSTTGSIVFIGALRPGSQYDLATRDGDVHLTLTPVPFTLAVRAKSVKSGFALTPLEEMPNQPDVRQARFAGAGPSAASLRLASATGEVVMSPLPMRETN